MHPYVLIPLCSGVAAVAIASAILARDSTHRANRLVAGILGCAAFWSMLEVIWNTQTDPDVVPWLIRISSLGWMPLGVLCVRLFMELSGGTRSAFRRALPALYLLTAACIGLYIATPWCIAAPVRTSWGWGYQTGPLFLAVYTPTAACAVATLAVLWRRVYPADAPPSERRQGQWAFVAVAFALAASALTDVTLPVLGIQVPRVGSASLTMIGATIAWSAHRYGYSLLTPGDFAHEILATLRDGVALIRHDGMIRVANGGLARLVGCPPDDLVGRALVSLLPVLEGPPDREIQELECELVPDAGRHLPVSISASIVVDRQGNRVGRVVVVRDLREVVGLRRRVVTSGRLAAVGELAAGIAHEINNPIAFVQANLRQLRQRLERLKKDDAPPPELHEIVGEGEELVDESLEGVERVAAIVRDIRGFSHAGRGERELGDLNAVIESALRMAAPQLRYRATLQRELGDIPHVPCNPQELKQVFLNLLLNAAHAIGESGTIRVSTQREEDGVVVRIEDDGCGIPQDQLDRIFDPFFTTKPVGEGTGLGLAISYQIVRNHDGDIQVESEPGGGTRFRLRIPEKRPAAKG